MRSDLLQTNFVGGEISPRLYGRPDLALYANSVKRARDVVIMQHGGATGRPGSDYVAEVKDSADATRLIPFVYSESTSYVLEHGDQYIRVFKNGAYTHEIASPYTSAQVFDVDYSQGADTMFMALQSVYPKRLQRWADTRWILESVPFDPAPFDEIGESAAVVITLGATTGATTATAAGAAFLASDVGRTLTYAGGVATIGTYTSTTVVGVAVTSTFSTVTLPASGWRITGSPQTDCTPSAKDPEGASITLTLGAAGWRSTDVGKFVQINGGLCEITGYTSSTIVAATVRSVLLATTAAEAGFWTLEGAVWNAIDGYPRSVTLYEQRAVWAGSSRYPQTLWGSKIGLYFDFLKGTADDASYSFELGSDELNPIIVLSSARDLVALTHGGAWALTGSIEKPITPTNVRARQQSKAGADAVRPEQVDDDLVYVQRGGERLRSLFYQADLSAYDDDEASTFWQHIATGIVGMTWQNVPERVLWAWKDDGTYLAITMNRKQNNIRAACLCTPGGGGFVESMATVPESGEDVTYMIVRRTVNGSTKRYIERMSWDSHQDCRVEITNSPASATVAGLSHLEGKTVSAVADGVDLGDFTVTSGAITLPRTASAISVGLRYVPTLQLLQPEAGTGMGAALGKKSMTGETRALFMDTVGCSVNGAPLSFRGFGADLLDAPVDPFTGWKDISGIGWATDSGEISITQPQSYPWTVLAVVRRVTANPG